MPQDRKIIPADIDQTATGDFSFPSISADYLTNGRVFDAGDRGNGDVAVGVNDIVANETPPYGIKIPAGDQSITQSLNLTGIKGGRVEVYAVGSRLNPTANVDGYPVVDTTDSVGINWYGGDINDGGNSPAFGVLEARDASTGAAAGRHNWFGLSVIGAFSRALWYNIGSETNNYYGCRTLSEGGGSGASEPAVLGFGTEDFLGATSSHANPGPGDCTQNYWSGCFFRSGHQAAVPDTVQMSGDVEESQFEDCYVYAGSTSGYRIRSGDRSSATAGEITLDNCRVEGTPTQPIHVTGPNGVSELTIRGGNFTSGSHFIKGESKIVNLHLGEGITNGGSNPITISDARLGYATGNFTSVPSVNTGTGVTDTVFVYGIDKSAFSGGGIYHAITMPFIDTANNRPAIQMTHGQDTLTMDHHSVGVHNAINLSGVSGDYPGQIRRDDGSNTGGSAWNYVEWTGSAWLRSDGTSFT